MARGAGATDGPVGGGTIGVCAPGPSTSTPSPARRPAALAEERAKLYIARMSEPATDPANVKLRLTLYLPRRTAERLMGQAIEQDKNFETLLRDILERAAGE